MARRCLSTFNGLVMMWLVRSLVVDIAACGLYYERIYGAARWYCVITGWRVSKD